MLHIALHGCLQNVDFVGTDYVTRAGYNKWADTNNMIILYPQVNLSLLSLFSLFPLSSLSSLSLPSLYYHLIKKSILKTDRSNSFRSY